MSRAVLSLGGNLGDRLGYLQGAVARIGALLIAASPIYETRPWGVTDQPDFLNAVCLAESAEYDPWAWLALAQRLEAAAGRVRDQRWGPRTLDVDIVAVDGCRSDHPRLRLPHPGTPYRASVLVPWLAVDPEAELPGYGPVAELSAALPAGEHEGLRRRDDLRLR